MRSRYGLPMILRNAGNDFTVIVHGAIESASEKGYQVRPHASSTDPKGRWDMAVILPAD